MKYYATVDEWFNILNYCPGVKGIQSENPSIYVFFMPGSNLVWTQNTKNSEPDAYDSGKIEDFIKNRKKTKLHITYWFDEENYKKIPDSKKPTGYSIEEIIDKI